MPEISKLDYLLAAFLSLNLAFVFFSAFFGRVWVRLEHVLSTKPPRRELPAWFLLQNFTRTATPQTASRFFFWSGIINSAGIILIRLFFVPHLL
jgi:hypothetical protein